MRSSVARRSASSVSRGGQRRDEHFDSRKVDDSAVDLKLVEVNLRQRCRSCLREVGR